MTCVNSKSSEIYDHVFSHHHQCHLDTLKSLVQIAMMNRRPPPPILSACVCTLVYVPRQLRDLCWMSFLSLSTLSFETGSQWTWHSLSGALRILLCLSPSAGITGASHVSSGIQIGPRAWMASTSVATTSLVSILWRILIWPGFDIAVICPVVKHFLTSRCWTPSGLNTFYHHMIHLRPSCFSSESRYVLGESAFAHILASYSHVEHCRCGKISEGPSFGYILPAGSQSDAIYRQCCLI